MSRSYVMIDLNDPRTAKIAEVMSNTTCKHILALLAEQELSESELAQRLTAPLNTINYNMKKLVSAGLVDPVRSLLSSKGRTVRVYRVSHKKIVISPKSLGRGLIPALLVSLVAALGIRAWSLSQVPMVEEARSLAATQAGEVAFVSSGAASLITSPVVWVWFLWGALVAIATLAFWDWFKTEKLKLF